MVRGVYKSLGQRAARLLGPRFNPGCRENADKHDRSKNWEIVPG